MLGVSLGPGRFQDGKSPLGTAGGEATTVDAAPDTTVGEFKGLVLRSLRPDDDALTRRVTSVELVLGKKRLLEDTATLAESGVSTDTVVMAVLGKRSVKRQRREDLDDKDPHDLMDPDIAVMLEIPDGTTEISFQAFAGCTAVAILTIPDSVTRIGKEAFIGCRSLTNLTMPKSITEIKDFAFADCNEIGAWAFGGSLEALTIPDSLTTIADGAFSGCSSLTKLAIAESVSKIGDWGFNGCSSLETLTIPDSVTEIGNYALLVAAAR